MMEGAVKLAAVAVTAAVLSGVLRKNTPELALLLTLAAAAAVLLALAEPVRELMTFLTELGERSGVSKELFVPLYKTVGIALVVKVGGELCRDAGEGAMAGLVEMAGAFAAILVSLPLFRAAWQMLEGLL